MTTTSVDDVIRIEPSSTPKRPFQARCRLCKKVVAVARSRTGAQADGDRHVARKHP